MTYDITYNKTSTIPLVSVKIRFGQTIVYREIIVMISTFRLMTYKIDGLHLSHLQAEELLSNLGHEHRNIVYLSVSVVLKTYKYMSFCYSRKTVEFVSIKYFNDELTLFCYKINGD